MKLITSLSLGALLVSSVAFADDTKEVRVKMDPAAVQAVNTEAVAEVNSLLKGELSAVETYRQVLEKVGAEPEGAQLKMFLADHQEAAKYLSQTVVKLGGQPETSSGAWGTWATAVTGVAKVLGSESALTALKNGEEHGLDEYKEATQDKNIPMAIKNDITDKLIPKQQAHIEALGRWIERL